MRMGWARRRVGTMTGGSAVGSNRHPSRASTRRRLTEVGWADHLLRKAERASCVHLVSLRASDDRWCWPSLLLGDNVAAPDSQSRGIDYERTDAVREGIHLALHLPLPLLTTFDRTSNSFSSPEPCPASQVTQSSTQMTRCVCR